ncbi:OmpH family outer membrane protein [Rhodohalobacter sp. 8-1]|uniref:OmpH family outer membrane protein n=1 Tax=Rhodohalobacter sp. 8-1 TaxID=3131972 RepID=UPI0030EE0E6C
MKRLISGIFILLALSETAAFAQEQKTGFIDSEIIMQNMPEYSGIEQRLNLLSEGWRDEIQELEERIAELEEEFEAREILFTEEVRQQRLNEIQNLRQQRDQLVEDKFGPDGEYFTTQEELLEPIQRQIFEAIDVVARRQNFDFVFDRSQQTRFLFVREEWNMTEDVMLEMGMDPSTVRN